LAGRGKHPTTRTRTCAVRSKDAPDRAGERVGQVDGLLIGEEERRVRFLRVASDPLLTGVVHHALVPVEAIDRVEADRVHLDPLRERIFSAPPFEPDRLYPPEYYAGLLNYYGYGPAVIPGVTTPVEPTGS
jgi:hypothetical protein